jgi:hypothetical protein
MIQTSEVSETSEVSPEVNVILIAKVNKTRSGGFFLDSGRGF